MTSSSKEVNGASIVSKMDSSNLATSLSKSPSGKSPSLWEQGLRLLLLVIWFNLNCICIVTTQFFGVPLALYDKNMFYAYYSQQKLSNI